MTGHDPIYLVSAYLAPTNPNAHPRSLISSDLKALVNLGSSVIVARDLNAKSATWCSHTTNPRGRFLKSLSSTLNFDVVAPMSAPHTIRAMLIIARTC